MTGQEPRPGGAEPDGRSSAQLDPPLDTRTEPDTGADTEPNTGAEPDTAAQSASDTDSASSYAEAVDRVPVTAGESTTPPSPAARTTEQAELDLGVVPTGHPGVDAALAQLADLPQQPVAEHPDTFDRVHAALHGALTELDEP